MRNLMKENDVGSDNESDKENDDLNMFSSLNSQARFKSFLEEISDNTNINNLDSVIDLNMEEITKNNKIPKRWTWSEEMLEALLLNITEYKAEKCMRGQTSKQTL